MRATGRTSCGAVRSLAGAPTVRVPVTRVPAMDKVVSTPADAVAGITDGATLAVGGFGLCGIPSVLIAELHRTGRHATSRSSRTTAASTTGGWASCCASRQIRRMVSSYVGENKEFARQYLEGELEVELTPQGTLAERLRAGGAGIPAFFTPTGVGSQVADGGLPWRYAADGTVAVSSPAKEVRVFERDGEEREYVLEHAIVADFGLVRAWKGDRHGNLVFNKSSRNFNPLAAMAGPGHGRRGRGARRARRARPRRRAPARHLRPAGAAAHPRAGRRQAHRAPHRHPRRRRRRARSPEPCP